MTAFFSTLNVGILSTSNVIGLSLESGFNIWPVQCCTISYKVLNKLDATNNMPLLFQLHTGLCI